MELARRWGIAENGAAVEVALAPTLLDELERRWPPMGLECSHHPVEAVQARFGLSDTWMVVPDREPSGTNPSPAAWDHLQTELTLFAVSRLTRLVPVHSAAIAWRGSVLVVPAAPEGGKSTLALAAHDVGAKVLSDEYTLIDPATGLVTGWNRSVRKRNTDGSTDLVDVAVPSDPRPVGLVALVHFDPAGAGWKLISPAEATAAILSHTICTRSRPDDAFDAVLAITRSSPVVRGSRGEAGEAIDQLLDHMERSAG